MILLIPGSVGSVYFDGVSNSFSGVPVWLPSSPLTTRFRRWARGRTTSVSSVSSFKVAYKIMGNVIRIARIDCLVGRKYVPNFLWPRQVDRFHVPRSLLVELLLLPWHLTYLLILCEWISNSIFSRRDYKKKTSMKKASMVNHHFRDDGSSRQ